jgi:ferric iron reductase protein FhuF
VITVEFSWHVLDLLSSLIDPARRSEWADLEEQLSDEQRAHLQSIRDLTETSPIDHVTFAKVAPDHVYSDLLVAYSREATENVEIAHAENGWPAIVLAPLPRSVADRSP